VQCRERHPVLGAELRRPVQELRPLVSPEQVPARRAAALPQVVQEQELQARAAVRRPAAVAAAAVELAVRVVLLRAPAPVAL
jgi:hypothetical protein